MRVVEWVDSTATCNLPWHDKAETIKECEQADPNDMLCHTCGFLLYEDDHMIVLTLSNHGDEVGMYICIPREAIRTTHTLRRRTS